MTTYPASLKYDHGRLASWVILQNTWFVGVSLMDMLITLDLAGDFDDGTPGWVDWEAIPDAIDLMNERCMLSSGSAAAMRLVITLASSPSLCNIDDRNRAAVRLGLRVMADAL